jgi:hypothetical protein
MVSRRRQLEEAGQILTLFVSPIVDVVCAATVGPLVHSLLVILKLT